MTSITNRSDVMNAKTSDLVAFYNEHAAKPVTKFADRRTAENRVLALLEEIKAASKQPKAEVIKTNIGKPAATADEVISNIRKAEKVKAKASTELSSVMSLDTRAKMAAAQRDTWTDSEIRAKRRQRSSVVVDGQPYGSVREAFEELGLPMGQHIKFRGELKAAGTLTEFGMVWEIAPLNY